MNAIGEPNLFDTALNGFSYRLSIKLLFLIAIYSNESKRHEKYIASAKTHRTSG
ncbi:protein of unknown function [Candidatus Nitrotoga arctica]|uniref:Uncharacterized protein n=1 Tax=Candidatus Nitrotoga arctica TaxID=453162 RepID=A0ABM8Z366_9PROT|nr:protein of unknown function [Candidatus Nitrotoga arctica]